MVSSKATLRKLVISREGGHILNGNINLMFKFLLFLSHQGFFIMLFHTKCAVLKTFVQLK